MHLSVRKALFLDRDGTLIKSFEQNGIPHPPTSISEVEPLPGVEKALRIFESIGFTAVVITNQPDVFRESKNMQNVIDINNMVLKIFNLSHIYTCFHDDIHKCKCRKPKPGLLHMAARDLNISLNKSLMVGDRWRDIQAGQSVGCECYFIDHGYREQEPVSPYTRVRSLLDVAEMKKGAV